MCVRAGVFNRSNRWANGKENGEKGLLKKKIDVTHTKKGQTDLLNFKTEEGKTSDRYRIGKKTEQIS